MGPSQTNSTSNIHMYVCMYVCIYICMHTICIYYIITYIYICTYIIRMYIYIHDYTRVHTYFCTHTTLWRTYICNAFRNFYQFLRNVLASTAKSKEDAAVPGISGLPLRAGGITKFMGVVLGEHLGHEKTIVVTYFYHRKLRTSWFQPRFLPLETGGFL